MGRTLQQERATETQSWHFVPEPQSCHEARRALDRFEDDLGVDLLKRLQLLVSELVGNATAHAGMAGRGYIELEILVTDERVRVTVSDRGPGFEPPPVSDDPRRHRQRGLQIVDAIAHRWGVHTNGRNRVWVELDRC